MSSIPVSPTIVAVTPGVLEAAGGDVELNGLVLSNSTRVPVGIVATFDSASAVGAFFGTGSTQYARSLIYFGGFNGATQTPGEILYTQFNMDSVAAYLRGGNVSGLSLAQLQALSGSLDATVDGYAWSAPSVSLSSATSFSSAATIITTALTASPPSEATGTGVVASESASFTATIGGNVMYVTTIASGTLVVGGAVSGAASGTVIDAQLSGTTGGIGTYAVNKYQQLLTPTSLTLAYGQLTVSGSITGVFAVGQTISGSSVPTGDIITALGTGTGGAGTYYVSSNTAVSSTSITASGTAPTVTYDSVSGAFILTSGIRGAASSVAYVTGTLAASIDWTQATGAVLSQGANPQTPAGFMGNLIASTQNFATFAVDYDMDGGPGIYTQKMAMAQWNSSQNQRFLYVQGDTDPNPPTTYPAESSFGYNLLNSGYSGTCAIWEQSGNYLAAFVQGYAASIDFSAPGGRATAAFKTQTGVTAAVTSQTAQENLAGNPQVANSFGNGYNFMGSFATATEPFIWFQRGTVSGPYIWLDTYLDQIWLNQEIINDLATLLNNANSIPYNAAGYAQVENSISDTIASALTSGVIVAGVQLSASQQSAVNQAASLALGQTINVASVISQRGWYLLATPGTPAQRQARTSPPFTLYYADGGSIQSLAFGSTVLQ